MSSPYADLERPPLPVAALRRALVRPDSFWTDVRVLVKTVSTNADVVAAAAGPQSEGLVVVAESQTGGRGRLGRAWVSPPRAGLTLSVLLRPPAPRERWGWLPLVAGLAVARAVAQVGEVDAVVKWPNDVLAGVSRGKVAGVLAEISGEAVVLGIGVNVSTRREELPRSDATSLAIEGAACADRMPLLVAILRALDEGYRHWLDGADVRGPYLQRCETVGRPVRVSYPDGRELTGDAVDVDGGGRLVVAAADGTRTAVAAGDITHLRTHVGQPQPSGAEQAARHASP